ncbi:hypothetical protein M3I54_31415 [Paraburkholderia sp. CNPSo 3274]|uniref:hypothetical protein n=1 Tax=Paraburkholderia sp. CNPSo 3274 TaxID=2940932 RepID=UPI0020B6DE4A|nr:hypothetical protein [Paraburkholderia sp. CNPSo 3274]MCP3711419.1 hypothetical protein [Paraburkholderia sp. CNPSo 3274]
MVTAAGTLPGRIAQMPNDGHLRVLSRALLLSAVLVGINIAGSVFLWIRLCSQAIVRRHFGESAASLIPIGLADVVPIWLLIKAEDGETSANMPKIDDGGSVIEDAANRLLPDEPPQQRIAVVKMKFRQIAAEEFTVMLARITPLDSFSLNEARANECEARASIFVSPGMATMSRRQS